MCYGEINTLKKRNMKRIFVCLLAVATLVSCAEKAPKQIGTLRQKTLSEVHNDLAVDCGTLDRDYADYHKYTEYLEPLGIRYIRLQAGWAKTEKVKGVYDFAWLDSIIDDAVSRGLEPWLELSYGNPIYPGGGTIFLNGGWPTSKEAIEAWKRWARATAERYKGKVHQWEIWNEPDGPIRKKGADPRGIVDLTIESARIIKSVDPDAKIAAFGLAGPRRAETCEAIISDLAKKLKANNEEYLIDWITYHGYHYIPEHSYFIDGVTLLEILKRHNLNIEIWQGECGAPSQGHMGGALSEYDWNEQTQAKWDLRKVMNDHGNGVRTSIFAMADMNYGASDAIKIKNLKGIVATTADNKVRRTKKAYHAVRNFVSVFDNLEKVCEKSGIEVSAPVYDSASEPLFYLFEDKETALQSLALWQAGNAPIYCDCHDYYAEVTIETFNCKNPVCLDILNGVVYEIPYRKCGKSFKFHKVPFYDSPMLICDKSLLEIQPLKK